MAGFSITPDDKGGFELAYGGRFFGWVIPENATDPWAVSITSDTCAKPPAPLRRFYTTFSSYAEIEAFLGIAADERRAA